MQREIKFRGKIKEKGMSESWLEGSLVHITKTYKGEEDEQECDIYQIINEDGVGFFIDKDTIGQYTGLKDKNGKKIYEGDYIEYKDDGEIFGKEIVKYSEKYAQYVLVDTGTVKDEFEPLGDYNMEVYEVIRKHI